MEQMKELVIETEDLQGFEEFLYERENSRATIRKYMTDIKTFQRFLGKDRVICKAKLLEYKEWLLAHYAVASANSMIVALNQYLNYKNASRLKLKRIKVQRQMFQKEEKCLTRAEYRRLIDAAYRNNKEQLALIIETIGATGIRISELNGFTIEQIRNGRIEIFNKGKNRIILIPSKLQRKLLKFAQNHRIRKGHLFVTRTGRPKDRSNLWSEMKRLYKDANVDSQKIFPHNLRHLFARCYYKATKDLAGLADLLGHSSLETTRIYTAADGSEFQKKVEQLQLVW